MTPKQYRAAKLTEDDVREVRRLHRAGWTGARIARAKGVTKENIYYILKGKIWRHVRDDETDQTKECHST